MELFKYQGAGNDFLIADNRDGALRFSAEEIAKLCDRRYGIGADGLMLLETAEYPYGFRMVYYNSDGSGGMMCGNGGRCIVAFAARCGIRNFHFIAADGPHDASILEHKGNTDIVKLKMSDVTQIEYHDEPDIDGYFLDTGTRHLVRIVKDVADYDVFSEGKRLRYHPTFGPVGVNVNFIEPIDGILKVRTYEKGVEAETYACGTGITASAIAAWKAGIGAPVTDGVVHQPIQALRDQLSVDFKPHTDRITDIYLTGPATYVARIII